MKKFSSLLLILSLVFLTACANTETFGTTAEQTADTTHSAETTTASEQTSETTTERKYIFETQIRETTPMKTETPELQEKIETKVESSDKASAIKDVEVKSIQE